MLCTLVINEVAGICNNRNVCRYARRSRSICGICQSHYNSVDHTLAIIRNKIHRRLIIVHFPCYLYNPATTMANSTILTTTGQYSHIVRLAS